MLKPFTIGLSYPTLKLEGILNLPNCSRDKKRLNEGQAQEIQVVFF